MDDTDEWIKWTDHNRETKGIPSVCFAVNVRRSLTSSLVCIGYMNIAIGVGCKRASRDPGM